MSSETRAGAVTIVGPSHPHAGGIAQHTTRLALELESSGVDVVVESWRAQYPKALYPSQARVAADSPEIGIPRTLREQLAWYSPLSWWRTGRRNRSVAVVGFNIPTPFHAVPYAVMISALGKTPRKIGIIHNALPHEASPIDRALMGFLLRRFDGLIAHDEKAGSVAQSLGADPSRISVCSLPSPWPAEKSIAKAKRKPGPTRALFFGTVRNYKGLDILINSMAETPDITLTVAGEFWDDQGIYESQINELGLESRVTIRPGYVPQETFSELFSSHDLLVMPYRSGTGSIVRELAFRFGLPVIATDVGSIAEGLTNDVNGLVIRPNSVEALTGALAAAANPSTLARWKSAIGDHAQVQESLWLQYCGVFLPKTTQSEAPNA